MTVQICARPIRLVLLALLAGRAVAAEDAEDTVAAAERPRPQLTLSEAEKLLSPFVGKWKGTCRTLSPAGKVVWEASVDGTFRRLEGGGLNYEFTARSASEKLRATFSLSYSISLSEVIPTRDGFFRLDLDRDDAKGQKAGWKTVYRVIDDHHLNVTTFRVPGSDTKRKATEFEYARAKE